MILTLNACKRNETGLLPVPPPTKPKPKPHWIQYHFGKSAWNQTIKGTVFGSGRDVTLIIASIHGDEPIGTPLLERFGNYLKSRPDLLKGRKAVIMPNVNPDGYQKHTRENSRGVDINHDFSSKHPQPETLSIIGSINYFKPRRIISIRQLDSIDYDGPGAKPLAMAIKKQCSLPIRRWGTSPGSLGNYGVENGISIITLGLPKKAMSEATAWTEYKNALIAAITQGIVPPDDNQRPGDESNWKKILERGKTYYRRERYKKALHEFKKCEQHARCRTWAEITLMKIKPNPGPKPDPKPKPDPRPKPDPKPKTQNMSNKAKEDMYKRAVQLLYNQKPREALKILLKIKNTDRNFRKKEIDDYIQLARDFIKAEDEVKPFQ